MSKRNFDAWFLTFTKTLRDYDYWVDWAKVDKNMMSYKDEFNILNGLIGVQEQEKEFRRIIKKYPRVIECVPILVAIREKEIELSHTVVNFIGKLVSSIDEICVFMKEVGLFDLFKNKKISNVYDYVFGIEVGLDSNARKNRTGSVMESLVEKYLLRKGYKYDKQINADSLEKKYGIDLSPIANSGKAQKRFDFSFCRNDIVYGIEVNFYGSQGSKLNETARSYKEIAENSAKIQRFKFVWITDGIGWKSAKQNLRETFDVMDEIYNIKDLENEVL